MDVRDFVSEQEKKLLDLKNARPWEIVQNINNKAYKLAIPKTLKAVGLTLIFHPWKIYVASNNPFPRQILLLGSPIRISVEDDKDYKTYKE